MTATLLPLFPLQLVLLPGSRLPLHIFEERYRVLVGECRATGMQFGVNLVRSGELAPIGCTARLTEVVHEYPDGRLDIVVEGVRRYRLLTRPSSVHPYEVGEVEMVEDVPEEPEPGLLHSTVELYNRLVGVVYRGKVPLLGGGEKGDLSFRMAQKAGLDLDARQRLLEATSVNGRLTALREYLMSVVPRLERLEEVERIIRSDGYIISPSA